MSAVTELKFEPPGPGSWSLDYTHWTRPVTRFQAEVFPEQFVRGFGESLKRYGLLLDYLDWEFVNGFPTTARGRSARPRMRSATHRSTSGTSSGAPIRSSPSA